ncbi:MAG: PilZ domain-containing protein [Pyrinomonadaceae bacterium]
MSTKTKTRPAKSKTAYENEVAEETAIFAIINGIDGEGEPWKEAADVINFTSSGIGFNMSRQCSVGTLISLMLNFPSHLRSYDHDEEFYRVWGLVQHCHSISKDDDETHQLGVAFVGSDPPSSYAGNPMQNYRICGMADDGLWIVTESKTRFVQRRELRHWKKIRPYLALIDNRRETIGGEWATTENISKGGAAVITGLELNVGDRVKFISEDYDFSGLAVVCNSHARSDGKMRLSLEFVENEFPIDTLNSRKYE